MSRILIGGIEMPSPCCIAATPAGAFYAVQSQANDPVRRYLLFLLSQPVTPWFTAEHLSYLHQDKDTAGQMLYRMQELGYVQVLNEPSKAEQGPLEEILPPLLSAVCDSGKSILADDQGFYIAMSGFAHESAEELSALSGSLYAVYERHQKLLHNNIGVRASALGVVDAAGNSDIGFWPLFYPRTRFSLILAGMPRFNCTEFTRMISCLAIRYSN